MAAHSAVDNLLNRRGRRAEDESSFLKHYEWVPIKEEEPRSPSPITTIARARRSPPRPPPPPPLPPPPPPPPPIELAPPPRRVSSTDSDSGLSSDTSGVDEAIETTLEDFDLHNAHSTNERCSSCILLNIDSGEPAALSVARQPRQLRQRRATSPPFAQPSPPIEELEDAVKVTIYPTPGATMPTVEKKPKSGCTTALVKQKRASSPALVVLKKATKAATSKSTSAECKPQPAANAEAPTIRIKLPSAVRAAPLAAAAKTPKSETKTIDSPAESPASTSPTRRKLSADTNAIGKLKMPTLSAAAAAEPKRKAPPAKLRRQQTAPELPKKALQSVGKLKFEARGDSAASSTPTKPTRISLGESPTPLAQRTTNARFHQPTILGCTAEISIQHYSLYETTARAQLAEPREKCLRIHLRLTSRLPTSAACAIVSPTNERTHRAFHHAANVSSQANGTAATSNDDNRRAAIDATTTTTAKRRSKSRTPPKRRLVEPPPLEPFVSMRPQLVVDVSVRILKEKLKRQQTDAELQTARSALRRVARLPRNAAFVAGAKDARNLMAAAAATVAAAAAVASSSVVQKCGITKKMRPPSRAAVAINGGHERKSSPSIAAAAAKSKNAQRVARNCCAPTSCTPNEARAQKIQTQFASFSSISGGSGGNGGDSGRGDRGNEAPPLLDHQHVLRIDEWERRLVDEFRRRLHIPILNLIYRQIFCLRCTACHLLEAARGPARALFVRRQDADRLATLADDDADELLRLFAAWSSCRRFDDSASVPSSPQQLMATSRRSAFFAPFGVSLRRTNRKQRRPLLPLERRRPRKWIPRWRRPTAAAADYR